MLTTLGSNVNTIGGPMWLFRGDKINKSLIWPPNFYISPSILKFEMSMLVKQLLNGWDNSRIDLWVGILHKVFISKTNM